MARDDIAALLHSEDYEGLVRLARTEAARVIRYLTGRLYSTNEPEKWRAVHGLGDLCGDPDITSEDKVKDLLQRFFWAMNDESGAVPYGIPEAIGEILSRRREFQAEHLPILCTMLTHEEMIQTGPIERGVMWALGRVGVPVLECSPEAVKALQQAVWSHPEEETRKVASWALEQIKGG